jgi:hypothetical protein
MDNGLVKESVSSSDHRVWHATVSPQYPLQQESW